MTTYDKDNQGYDLIYEKLEESWGKFYDHAVYDEFPNSYEEQKRFIDLAFEEYPYLQKIEGMDHCDTSIATENIIDYLYQRQYYCDTIFIEYWIRYIAPEINKNNMVDLRNSSLFG